MNDYSLISTPRSMLKTLAGRVKILRKKEAYSQSDFAKRSGVSLGSLKRFESTGQISLESFLKLLHLLDRLSEFDRLLQPDNNLEDIEKLFSKK